MEFVGKCSFLRNNKITFFNGLGIPQPFFLISPSKKISLENFFRSKNYPARLVRDSCIIINASLKNLFVAKLSIFPIEKPAFSIYFSLCTIWKVSWHEPREEDLSIQDQISMVAWRMHEIMVRTAANSKRI